MKKTITTIALLAVLGTLAVSCQKENIVEQTSINAEAVQVYKVSYSIDGRYYQLTLIGEESWHDFLTRMFALAEEGHRVSFRNENVSSQEALSKEVVTYTTSDHDDAYTWAEKMSNAGYLVTVEYDRKTGKYTCTAIK